KKSARDTLKAEEARIQLRHMDLEMAREQSKSRAPPYAYGLAPVQQQVLAHERSTLKRSRNSISNETEQLSHDKVMEALKAKIQRGNHSQSSHSLKDAKKIKQPFRPMSKIDIAVNSPSPKSAKPILPPIDTSVGRVEQTAIVEESTSTVSNNSTSNNEIIESKKLSPVECRPDCSLTTSQ
ncbi:hypothetical protein CU098_010267, partial [Rhizopus stolonifer]